VERRIPEQAYPATQPRGPALPTAVGSWRGGFDPTDRSCCCQAAPQVKIVLPAGVGRRLPTDLLLCAHHFRLSREVLSAMGAAAYDAAGTVLPTTTPEPDAGGHARGVTGCPAAVTPTSGRPTSR
jgi:hypothetical protein